MDELQKAQNGQLAATFPKTPSHGKLNAGLLRRARPQRCDVAAVLQR
jgi:hypothetical protein